MITPSPTFGHSSPLKPVGLNEPNDMLELGFDVVGLPLHLSQNIFIQELD